MSEIIPKAVVARIQSSRTLPTMPGVALSIVKLCESEDASVNEIAEVVQQDPALSVRILRYANGTSFGVRGSVTTVRRAAALLGSTTVKTLALSFSLTASMQATKVGGFDHRRYWLRSLFCAASAQAIATSRGMHSPEVLFISSLVQDLGMLVLAHALGDEYTTVIDHAGKLHHEVVAAERAKFGFDHADVTAWLATEWSLPTVFRSVAEASHGPIVAQPPSAGGPPTAVDLPILLSSHIADIFCADDVALACQRAEAVATALFGMTHEDFSGVLAHTTKIASAGAALLNIDPGPPGNMAHILESARDVLRALTTRSTERRKAVSDVSVRDPLTGLWNRAHVDGQIEALLGEANRSGDSLVVALCDIDMFRSVNDSYGRAVGDEVLWTVGRRLSEGLHDSGVVGRYGGEEFVVVLPKTALHQGEDLCERLREAVDATVITARDGRPVRATVSFGVAATGEGVTTLPALLQAAGGALRDAKRSGRNRVCSTYPPNQVPASGPRGR